MVGNAQILLQIRLYVGLIMDLVVVCKTTVSKAACCTAAVFIIYQPQHSQQISPETLFYFIQTELYELIKYI
jgi:hypothetical protein